MCTCACARARACMQVNCWFFKSKGVKPGPWPKGMCYPRDNNCKSLGIKDNLCGKCVSLGGGAFRLIADVGLRFNGYSFDDNRIGKGSFQACILKKTLCSVIIGRYKLSRMYRHTF